MLTICGCGWPHTNDGEIEQNAVGENEHHAKGGKQQNQMANGAVEIGE
jgi:hypothetical protein